MVSHLAGKVLNVLWKALHPNTLTCTKVTVKNCWPNKGALKISRGRRLGGKFITGIMQFSKVIPFHTLNNPTEGRYYFVTLQVVKLAGLVLVDPS